jgi:hypothetical protein
VPITSAHVDHEVVDDRRGVCVLDEPAPLRSNGSLVQAGVAIMVIIGSSMNTGTWSTLAERVEVPASGCRSISR